MYPKFCAFQRQILNKCQIVTLIIEHDNKQLPKTINSKENSVSVILDGKEKITIICNFCQEAA